MQKSSQVKEGGEKGVDTGGKVDAELRLKNKTVGTVKKMVVWIPLKEDDRRKGRGSGGRFTAASAVVALLKASLPFLH